MTNETFPRRRPTNPAPVTAAALLAVLGLLTALERTGAVAARPDSAVLHWMLTHRSGHLTTVAVAITNSGTSPLLYPLVIVAGLAVWRRTGQWSPGVVALTVIITGVLTRLELSKLVADPRPPSIDWLLPVHGYSFPSGHAATSALFAGTLSWLLTRLVPHGLPRRVVAIGLGSWAVLVAFSRIYLGVHWISDIAGSWLLAGLWLLILPAASRLPRRRKPTPRAVPKTDV